MRHFILLLFLTMSGFLSAQKGTVTGSVYDAVTKETLLSAAVMYGPSQGIPTDFDGRYSIELEYGTYTLSVSYVGYEPISKEIVLDSRNMVVDFAMGSIMMNAANVTADLAIERETPVAFSNIKPLQIQEELGSQPMPMILNSTPGVYATQDGSDDTGPSITIRGFKQRNVSVLLDGIPVNDMENGRVFWSNWFGLDMVTQTMQVQRGLGASKLALPAIGGTVNILTQGIESKRKTRIKQEVTTLGRLRTSIGHTTGRTEKGWGFTLAGSFLTDDGFAEQTYSDSWFYYVKAQKEVGNHVISLSAMGSPSENGTRGYRQRLATYSKDYARELFTGSDEEYDELAAYSVAFTDIVNQNLLPAALEEAIDNLNQEYGYDSIEDYLELQRETNFIDTTGIREMGIRYNPHWGELNGEILPERQNKYHKPLISLRDSWTINDKWYWSNTLYYSQGLGGGSRLEPGLGGGDYDENLQIDFDRFYGVNTVGTLFGPPINPTYSETELQSTKILRKLFNNHYWLGALSTFKYDHSERLSVSGGLDVRTYRGEHYAEVFNLLGGDYFVSFDSANDETPQDRVKRVGDKIGYHNDSFVRWGGLFALVEYKRELWNVFLNVSAVRQGYNRVDYFLPQVVVDSVLVDGSYEDVWDYQKTDWIWKNGFTVKAGGNYKINEFSNVFTNIGHLNRTPIFRDVIDFGNRLIENTQNEEINSVELGYSYSRNKISFNVNGYYTDWNNRPLDDKLTLELSDGTRVTANISAMSAVHMGIELDGAYQIAEGLIIEGFVSLGDWRWDSSADSLILINQTTALPYIDPDSGEPVAIHYDASGVSVGDAPQTQIGGSVKWNFGKGLYLKPRYTLFSRHYAEFDPFSLRGENVGRQSWVIPTYGLLDVHAGYGFKIKESHVDIRVSVYNALNSDYISNALNNERFSVYNFNDPDRIRPPQFATNFDAASAGVFLGQGIRSNISLSVRF